MIPPCNRSFSHLLASFILFRPCCGERDLDFPGRHIKRAYSTEPANVANCRIYCVVHKTTYSNCMCRLRRATLSDITSHGVPSSSSWQGSWIFRIYYNIHTTTGQKCEVKYERTNAQNPPSFFPSCVFSSPHVVRCFAQCWHLFPSIYEIAVTAVHNCQRRQRPKTPRARR